MRAFAFALALAAGIVGTVALAQEQTTPGDAPTEEAPRFRAQYETRPDAPRGRRYYPESSVYRSEPGSVLLCCRPRADRTLSCEVAFEAPENREFGSAARRVVEDRQQLTEESYAAYAQAAPGAIPLPMRFQVEGGAPAPALPSDTWGLCNPALTS